MREDPVYVLDLGSTKAVCLAASLQDDGQIAVRAVASVPCRGLKRGVVADIDEAAESVDAAVGQVERSLGGRIEGLVAGISGPHLQSVNAQGFVPIYPQSRPVRREDVMQVIGHSRQMMMPPDREQIIALPREFRLDGQRGVHRPIGMSGGRLEVVTHIVTGQSTHIQNLERAVTQHGRRIDQLIVSALAAGVAVVSPEAMDLGCIVMDIGGGTTDIAIFAGGAVTYTASIPIGSAHVTSDISTLLKTTLEEAERLKVSEASAIARVVPEDETVLVKQVTHEEPRPLQRRVLCEIVESRMREVADFVQKHIEMSGMNGLLPAGAFLTGGGSELRGVDSLFSEACRHIKARAVRPKVTGPHARTVDKAAMAAAVGLAKFALEGEENEFVPASGASHWKDRIRTLKSLFTGKA